MLLLLSEKVEAGFPEGLQSLDIVFLPRVQRNVGRWLYGSGARVSEPEWCVNRFWATLEHFVLRYSVFLPVNLEFSSACQGR